MYEEEEESYRYIKVTRKELNEVTGPFMQRIMILCSRLAEME